MADPAWNDNWWMPESPSLEVFLLGLVDYEECDALQRRLVEQVQAGPPDQVYLIVVEHPPIITMGRSASWSQVRADPDELARVGMRVRWVDRGGGPTVHGPGQLVAYPILDLKHWQLRLSEYIARLETVLVRTLDDSFIRAETFPGLPGVWARDAAIAQIGLGVSDWVTYHGLSLNVCPDLRTFSLVDVPGPFDGRVTSMSRDRRRFHDMASVRESLVRHFESVFGLSRSHLYTTHPRVARLPRLPVYAGSPA